MIRLCGIAYRLHLFLISPNFIVFNLYLKEQSPSECSGSRSKRLHTLSEEEKTADHGVLPSVSSDVHNKEDDEEEDNKRKVQN